jgi:hypothetical protein
MTRWSPISGASSIPIKFIIIPSDVDCEMENVNLAIRSVQQIK